MINKLKEFHNAFLESSAFSITDVDKFFNKILLLVAEEFDSKVSYFISLNRMPNEYEHKIEKVYKACKKEIVNEFQWWYSEDLAYLPLVTNEKSLIKYIYKALDFDIIPNASAHRIIERADYLQKLKDSVSSEQKIDLNIKNIEKNFEAFEGKILILNIGVKDDSDGVFIIDIDDKVKINNEKIESQIYYINSIIINFLLKVKTHRENFISKFNNAISSLNITNEHYIEGIIDALAEFFKDSDGTNYCSEMGVFERFANKIDINSINFKCFYEPKTVYDKLGEQPLTIGEQKTIIDHVAYVKHPYYVESINNPKHKKLYEPVIETTKSQLTIPLIFQENLIGVLNMGVNRENGFLPYDRKMLINLSGIIAFILWQRKMFLFQSEIASNFIDKILLIREDNILKTEIEKEIEAPRNIQNALFKYMLPIHENFVNYNLMLSSLNFSFETLKNSIELVNDFIKNTHKEYIKTYYKEFTADDKSKHNILDQFVFELRCNNNIKIKTDEELLQQALISFYIYSIDNCVTDFKKTRNKTKAYKIYTNVYIENEELIIDVSNNGQFPTSKSLYKRFNAFDYPKPIPIQIAKGRYHSGIPFILIDYFFTRNSKLVICEDVDGNSIKLCFPAPYFIL